jgi:hypothetical protein
MAGERNPPPGNQLPGLIDQGNVMVTLSPVDPAGNCHAATSIA